LSLSGLGITLRYAQLIRTKVKMSKRLRPTLSIFKNTREAKERDMST
jgi:hypothetical protein